MSAKKVLKKIEKKAKKEGLPIVGPKKGKVLVEVIKKHQPSKILEVGTNVGYSAILMAKAFSKKARKKVKIVTIENKGSNFDSAKRNIKKAGYENVVEVILGNAKKVIPDLEGNFEMMFIDAVKEDYLEYLELAEPKLTDDAVIVADNVKIFAYQLQDYLYYVRNNDNYESETYDFGDDAVEVSVRK